MAESSDQLHHQGDLGVKRRKGVESRYFLLFADRLDYYKHEKDAGKGEDPRGRLNLGDIISIENTTGDDGSRGLVFKLDGDQNLELLSIAPGGADLPDWVAALAKVVDRRKMQGLTSAPSASTSSPATSNSPEAVRRPEADGNVPSIAVLLMNGQELMTTDPSTCTNIVHLRERIAEASRKKGLDWQANRIDLVPREWGDILRTRQVQAFSTFEAGQCVLQGSLGVQRKDKITQRHFVLHTDCLEYFEAEADFVKGSEPRGRVMLADVARIQASYKGPGDSQDGFSVFIYDEKRPLELKGDKEKDCKDWVEAISRLIGSSPQESAGTQAAPSQPPAPASVVAPAASSSGNEQKMDVVCNGIVSVLKKGKVEERYFILWQDRFEYYNSLDEHNSGGNPRCRVPLDQVLGFEIHDDQFHVQLQDRKIMIQVKEGDMKRWAKAWSEVGQLSPQAAAAVLSTPTPAANDSNAMRSASAAAPTVSSAPSPSPAPAPVSAVPAHTSASSLSPTPKPVTPRDDAATPNSAVTTPRTPTKDDEEHRRDSKSPPSSSAKHNRKGLRRQRTGSLKGERKKSEDDFEKKGRSRQSLSPEDDSDRKGKRRQSHSPDTASEDDHSPPASARWKSLADSGKEDLTQAELENFVTSLAAKLAKGRKLIETKIQRFFDDKVRTLKNQKTTDWTYEGDNCIDIKVIKKTDLFSVAWSSWAEDEPKPKLSGKALVAGPLTLVKKRGVENRYVVVLKDHIEIYSSLKEMEEGEQPRGLLAADDIKGIKANSNGFILEMDTKTLDFQCQSSSDIDKWVENIRSILSSEARAMMFEREAKEAKAQLDEERARSRDMQGRGGKRGDAGGKRKDEETTSRVDNLRANRRSNSPKDFSPQSIGEVLHQGALHLDKEHKSGRGHKSEPKHAVISKAPDGCKLIIFDSKPEDLSKPRSDALEILVSSIRAFKVTDDGFIISTDKRDFKLKVSTDLESWVNGFRDIFREQANMEATVCSSCGNVFAADAAFCRKCGKQRGEAARLAGLSSPLSATSPRPASSPSHSPRSNEASPRGRSRERDAKWLTAATGGAKSPSFEASAPKVAKPKWSTAHLNDSHLQHWLSELQRRDPVLHDGLLGVQPKGPMGMQKFVTGYFVLFKDRLDFWNEPIEASSGKRPVGRIMLTEVRSLETVSSGFILNYKGRKMGLHVTNNEDLHKWSRALLSALAPSQDGDGDQPGSAKSRAMSEPPPSSRSKSPTRVGKQMKLDMDPELCERTRQQLYAMVGTMTVDRIFKFLDKNRNGTIAAEELKKAVKNTALKNGVDMQVSEAELQQFVTAIDMDGTGNLKVDRIVMFIEHGAEGTGGKGRPKVKANSKMPPNWVPRVALLAHGHPGAKKVFIDPEEEAFNSSVQPGRRKLSIMRQRRGGLSLVVPTNDHPRKLGGQSWKDVHYTGKVNQAPPTEQVTGPVDRKRRTSRDQRDLQGKITSGWGDDRVIPTDIEQKKACPWTKINHYSQDTAADPDCTRGDKPSSKDPSGANLIPGKVGGEDRYPMKARGCLTEKVTDSGNGRKPLCVREAFKEKNSGMTVKVTDSGRTCTGWARPFGEDFSDKSRSMMQNLEKQLVKPGERSTNIATSPAVMAAANKSSPYF